MVSGINDVSCHNRMQICKVICYGASIRDIPSNEIVGKSKNNQRPLNAATGQSLTDHHDVDSISATFLKTRILVH